jgi:hypothetical protein
MGDTLLTMGSETGGNKESAQKAAADSKDNEMSFKAFL